MKRLFGRHVLCLAAGSPHSIEIIGQAAFKKEKIGELLDKGFFLPPANSSCRGATNGKHT